MCVNTYSRTHIHIHTCALDRLPEKLAQAVFSRASFILLRPAEFFIARKARPRPLISTLRALMIPVQFSLLCGLDTLHCNSNHPKHHSKHEVITFHPKCKWLSAGDSFWELGLGQHCPDNFFFPS